MSIVVYMLRQGCKIGNILTFLWNAVATSQNCCKNYKSNVIATICNLLTTYQEHFDQGKIGEALDDVKKTF